jgi:hypothetical protein
MATGDLRTAHPLPSMVPGPSRLLDASFFGGSSPPIDHRGRDSKAATVPRHHEDRGGRWIEVSCERWELDVHRRSSGLGPRSHQGEGPRWPMTWRHRVAGGRLSARAPRYCRGLDRWMPWDLGVKVPAGRLRPWPQRYLGTVVLAEGFEPCCPHELGTEAPASPWSQCPSRSSVVDVTMDLGGLASWDMEHRGAMEPRHLVRHGTR